MMVRKPSVIIILTLLSCFSAWTQGDHVSWKEASKESQAYHNHRLNITLPPYGLEKIQLLLKHIKPNADDDKKLSANIYQSLNFREKFTYHMIHAESFSQNCAAEPPFQNEQKKIFAQLPNVFYEFDWSDAQIKFFKSNHDSVVYLLKESITRTNRVGLNYKQVIADINAKEMIPLLVSTYQKNRKDLDLLTVLMLLMKDNKYQPFLASSSFTKLYRDDADYKSFIEDNAANEDLILQRAGAFYTSYDK